GVSVMSGDKQTAIAGLVCVLFLSHAVAQTPPVTPSPELERLSSVRLLQRSQVLNQMRETIGARLKDIASELRNSSIKLNIDGYAAPGRVSAKEVELSELVRREIELRQASNSVNFERNALAKTLENKKF